MSLIDEDIKSIVESQLPWERFHNCSVLVTGATGFIAHYIVLALLALNRSKNINVKVYALARSHKKFFARYASHLENPNLVFVPSSVEDDFSQFLQDGVEYIIHAASFASPKYYGVDPVGTLSANTLGTSALLDLAVRFKSKGFTYISSAEVYGVPRNTPTSEDDYGYIDPINLRSCYAESKRMGEAMCMAWSSQWGVPIKIVRPFHTYGPGMDLEDGRIYADLVKSIVTSESIVLSSDGSAIRAFCYLTDAVLGVFTIMLIGQDNNAYNLGNDQGVISILDLANLLREEYSDRVASVVTEASAIDGYIPSKVNRVLPNIDKLKSLGWAPKVDLRVGFRRTIESYI